MQNLNKTIGLSILWLEYARGKLLLHRIGPRRDAGVIWEIKGGGCPSRAGAKPTPPHPLLTDGQVSWTGILRVMSQGQFPGWGLWVGVQLYSASMNASSQASMGSADLAYSIYIYIILYITNSILYIYILYIILLI